MRHVFKEFEEVFLSYTCKSFHGIFHKSIKDNGETQSACTIVSKVF